MKIRETDSVRTIIDSEKEGELQRVAQILTGNFAENCPKGLSEEYFLRLFSIMTDRMLQKR